jgi:uncharacterized membrane protein
MALGNPGLDGLAYLKDVAPAEYAAVTWVRQHTNPTDVVAEAYGPSQAEPTCGSDYWICGIPSDANVMSALSGRPTLIGWPGSHEALWQGDYGGGAGAAAADALISQRERDTDQLFSTTDPRAAESIIKRYRIAYVFVGPFEQSKYYASPDSPALANLQSLLGEPVFRAAEAALYQVPASLRG